MPIDSSRPMGTGIFRRWPEQQICQIQSRCAQKLPLGDNHAWKPTWRVEHVVRARARSMDVTRVAARQLVSAPTPGETKSLGNTWAPVQRRQQQPQPCRPCQTPQRTCSIAEACPTPRRSRAPGVATPMRQITTPRCGGAGRSTVCAKSSGHLLGRRDRAGPASTKDLPLASAREYRMQSHRAVATASTSGVQRLRSAWRPVAVISLAEAGPLPRIGPSGLATPSLGSTMGPAVASGMRTPSLQPPLTPGVPPSRGGPGSPGGLTSSFAPSLRTPAQADGRWNSPRLHTPCKTPTATGAGTPLMGGGTLAPAKLPGQSLPLNGSKSSLMAPPTSFSARSFPVRRGISGVLASPTPSLVAATPGPLSPPLPFNFLVSPISKDVGAGRQHQSASFTTPGAEGKIRRWLKTIPIGNGEERGWDDAQIQAIAIFAKEHHLEHLAAEEMYKRFVEHQVASAEEESPDG